MVNNPNQYEPCDSWPYGYMNVVSLDLCFKVAILGSGVVDHACRQRLRPDISADFAEAFSSPNSVSRCTLFEFYNCSACDVHFVHDTEMNLTLTCFL